MENELKKRVMRRIYIIYAKNIFFRNGFLVVTLVIVTVLFLSVSISDIMRNTPKDSLSSFSKYMILSFNNTEAATKALMSLLVLTAMAPLINSKGFSLRLPRGLRLPS
jgi:hypothetical protein